MNETKTKDETFKCVGRITDCGERAVRFWVRVLELEKEVQIAIEWGVEHLELGGCGAVPIVSEYKVDDKFEFIYVIVIHVDLLGIQDGEIVIFYTDPERRESIMEVRNKLADDILRSLKENRPNKIWIGGMETKKHV